MRRSLPWGLPRSRGAWALVVLACALVGSARAQENDWARRVASLLGGACDPLVPANVQATCGMDGRVAVVRLPVDYLPEPPANAERLFDGPGARPNTHRIVALVGERLWVHDVTCTTCVRAQGRTFVVDLPTAPPDTMVDLQRQLGLDAARPFRSARELRAAYARGRSRRGAP